MCRISFLRRALRLTALATFGLLAGGCQIIPEPRPDPTRYFVLTETAPTVGSPTNGEVATGVTIGLRPLELPAYLRNTKSLVVARGVNEVTYRDYDRWAEPLDSGLGRVLRDALATNAKVQRVVSFPFPAEQPRDFDLTVRIRRCEGAESDGGRRVARFALSFEISRAGVAGEVVRRGSYVAPERPWDGDASSLAALLGEAAATAGHAIADELP
jgi:uncharacterized lipoprotein YmbA